MAVAAVKGGDKMEGGGGVAGFLQKIICNGEDVFHEVETKIRIKELYENMASALGKREKRIVELRYGLCGMSTLTQKEIASLMGISRSYVSRIEKKALKKLYERLKYD